MLIDEVDITLKAGHGGAGKVSFVPSKNLKGGPDGGNGGRGGDVYIKVTSDLTVLNRFSREKLVAADNGEMGGNNRKFGKAGKDVEVLMPVGTELLDKKTGEKFELNEVDEKFVICKGGLGGRGNFELRSSRNTTPLRAQKGLPGQERDLEVHLKLIADLGLIGLPNAGKSSLLNELTAASAKVANYPFTTLEPNLGVLQNRIIADIPGLIEGASIGKGLGIRFLKHIEKVKLLLHCIAADSEDVAKDYQVVHNELKSFNPELLDKEEIILITKSDLVEKKASEASAKNLKKFKKTILTVSIHDWDSLQKLREMLSDNL